MKKLLPTALLLTANVLAQPPVAKKIPHRTSIHGQELVDSYFWMRNYKDPDVKAYLKAENAYTDRVMAPLKKLEKCLYQEMLSRVQEDDQRPPYRKGKFGYFSRTEKGKAYPILCRRPWGKRGPVEVLLDLNELAKGHPYLGIGDLEISPDDSQVAYTADFTGYRQYQLSVLDLKTHKVADQHAERVTSLAWGQDNRTLFYTTEDKVTKRSDQFWRLNVGVKKPPELLYREPDELFDVACEASRDATMVLLNIVSKTSSECRFRSADASPQELRVLRAREKDHEYQADFFQGRFVIRTNLGAPTFKLVTAPLESPQQWTDLLVLPEGEQVDEFCLFPHRLAVAVRQLGVPGLALFDPATGKLQEVRFREQVRSLNLTENEDPQLDTVRVEYESPVTPPTTYDVELATGKLHKIRQQPVPNYDARRYRCQRWQVKVRDGVMVPVTLVYRAGIEPGKGGHPTLLEGYGSYGSIDDPAFSQTVISLLDRGVVYAYAHIRGGGELGEPWRQAGRMQKKMNTFNDFVDCAQNLIDSGWTRRDGLAICGGSAGGLLVGAAINQRPEIFQAAVARVPFVDVINTMLDASLPLTTSEYIEWGNPHEKEAFDTMMSYSPYDNLAAKAYPSVLVKVSVHDSQVPYWEGAKFVARMRSLKTDSHPLLLKTNFAAGHGGSSGRYARLKERAFDFAYILWQLGLAH